MADENRPFVIPLRRRWLLLILPILATLYFLAVVAIITLDYEIAAVPNDTLVLAGVGLFAAIILLELPFFLRRRRRRERPAESAPVATGEPATAPAARASWDDELVTTSETQQGLRVVEYSSPAKSRNSNAVYTKTYVPVSGAHVLRVESLVADARDL